MDTVAQKEVNKKFELVKDDTKYWCGRTLYRIRALIAIESLVAAGELGGYVEFEKNVSQSGDAWVYGDAQIIWFSKVGSENGTLTVARSASGLFVNRGCFSGTDIEFLAAVDKHHGAESKIGHEYHLLIEVARSRIDTTTEIEAQP